MVANKAAIIKDFNVRLNYIREMFEKDSDIVLPLDILFNKNANVSTLVPTTTINPKKTITLQIICKVTSRGDFFLLELNNDLDIQKMISASMNMIAPPLNIN